MLSFQGGGASYTCSPGYTWNQRTHHDDGLGVYALGHHLAVVRDVLHHLVKPRPLDLLVLEVAERVADEVEQNAALPQLLHEQILSLRGRGIWGQGHIWV